MPPASDAPSAFELPPACRRIAAIVLLTLATMAGLPGPSAYGAEGAASPSAPSSSPSPSQGSDPRSVPGTAEDEDTDQTASRLPSAAAVCREIAKNADAVGMDRDFFARLIWKESRFDAGAVSPVGAQGIAQFMPYTAKERGLADPYDFEAAIRHSATYLRDLKGELGNWGLAAAAYNGGINRVKRWMADGGSLPYETENYVASITSRSADWFRESGHKLEPKPLDDELDFDKSCRKLPVMKTRALFASTPDSAPMKPWGVQVAGHEQRAIALRMFHRVQSAYSSILGGLDPIVMRTRTSPLRRIYAVRIGEDSRGEADALCRKLRSAGGSCLVMKN